jgi:hypothetical protein
MVAEGLRVSRIPPPQVRPRLVASRPDLAPFHQPRKYFRAPFAPGKNKRKNKRETV